MEKPRQSDDEWQTAQKATKDARRDVHSLIGNQGDVDDQVPIVRLS